MLALLAIPFLLLRIFLGGGISYGNVSPDVLNKIEEQKRQVSKLTSEQKEKRQEKVNKEWQDEVMRRKGKIEPPDSFKRLRTR